MGKTFRFMAVDKEVADEIEKVRKGLQEMMGRPVSNAFASKFLFTKLKDKKRNGESDVELKFDFKV